MEETQSVMQTASTGKANLETPMCPDDGRLQLESLLSFLAPSRRRPYGNQEFTSHSTSSAPKEDCQQEPPSCVHGDDDEMTVPVHTPTPGPAIAAAGDGRPTDRGPLVVQGGPGDGVLIDIEPTEPIPDPTPLVVVEDGPGSQDQTVIDCPVKLESLPGPTREETGKGPAEPGDDGPDADLSDVDEPEDEDENWWARYPAPSALSSAPMHTPNALFDVVQTSIERVKASIAEAERRRQQEIEETERREREEQRAAERLAQAAIEREKARNMYANADRSGPPTVASAADDDGGEEGRPSSTLTISPVDTVKSDLTDIDAEPGNGKGRRKRRFGLARLLNRLGPNEKGESSAAAAARNSRSSLNLLRTRSRNNTMAEKDAKLRKLNLTAEVLQKLANLDPETYTTGDVKGKGKEKETVIQDDKPDATEPALVECVSCMEDFPASDMIKAPCHSYCNDCFTLLIAASVKEELQWPPKCCLNEIPTHTIYKYITTDLRRTFDKRSAEWKTPIADRIYCSNRRCGVWVPPESISRKDALAVCPAKHKTCIFCRGPSHGKSECPQDTDIARTRELAAEEGWQRCAKCGMLVEHTMACRHMKCRCGYQFCYVCNAVWETCDCNAAQLQSIKDTAERKREERKRREAAAEQALRRAEEEARRAEEERQQHEDEEAEELRAALAQIEQMELREALEAIQLEIVREEAEAAVRKEEIAGILRLEARRVEKVRARFLQYRCDLVDLHDMQRDILGVEARAEMDGLAAGKAAALAEVARERELALAQLDAGGAARSRDFEHKLAEERKLREKIQEAAEVEYLKRLQAAWGEDSDGLAEICTAINAYRERMARNREEWEALMGADVEEIELSIKAARRTKEESMARKMRSVEGMFGRRERAGRKQRAAGLRWLEAVAQERARMLDEMEAGEAEEDMQVLEAYDPLEVVEVRESEALRREGEGEGEGEGQGGGGSGSDDGDELPLGYDEDYDD